MDENESGDGVDSPLADDASVDEPDTNEPDTNGYRRTDGPADDPEGAATALPSRIESWRRRSALGAILTGFAFGLREVFVAEPQQPSIIMETSGEPPTDLPVEAEVDQRPARHSVVKIRPWLLDDPVAPSTSRGVTGRGDDQPESVPEPHRAPRAGQRRAKKRS